MPRLWFIGGRKISENDSENFGVNADIMVD